MYYAVDLHMKFFLPFSALFIAAPCLADDLAAAVKSLQAVGREGSGNVEATAAWQTLSKADPKSLPEVLSGINGANPLAENWLRAAVDAIADKAIGSGTPLPLEKLKTFLNETSNASGARVVAFDLIQQASAKEADQITPRLLEDPSAELRRHPVSKLIDEGDALLAKNDKSGATTVFQKAIRSARDEDQIKKLAKSLKDLGSDVNLVDHFGFLTDWHLVAPFTNVDRKGFDEVFPPEKSVNLTDTYEGKTAQVKWVDFKSTDPYGMVDFNKPFGLEKQVTGFAYTEFTTNEARDAEIRLGCKNGWKVWLNGELLFARDEYHRGMKLDQYKIPASLKKGKNSILVKCCQNEQTESWTVEWQFQLRVCDSTGTAIIVSR